MGSVAVDIEGLRGDESNDNVLGSGDKVGGNIIRDESEGLGGNVNIEAVLSLLRVREDCDISPRDGEGVSVDRTSEMVSVAKVSCTSDANTSKKVSDSPDPSLSKPV